MSITRFLALPVSVLVILSLAACSFTGAPAVVAQPTQAPAVPLDTQVAEALASTAALQTAVQANPFGIMQVQSLKETMVNPGAVASLFEPKRPSKKQIVPL